LVRICIPLLLMNFSWIVSANGCRHVVLNHFNLSALCGRVIFYSALFYFFCDRGFGFLTTPTSIVEWAGGQFIYFLFFNMFIQGKRGKCDKKIIHRPNF
jgi:hypothetical protein